MGDPNDDNWYWSKIKCTKTTSNPGSHTEFCHRYGEWGCQCSGSQPAPPSRGPDASSHDSWVRRHNQLVRSNNRLSGRRLMMRLARAEAALSARACVAIFSDLYFFDE